ncbi:MAG: hypothetical protein JWN70_7053 [Planctomycetaceae bacterium]|nr:hypothetical protein [Planctomycetaceae bacterium]
MSNATSYCDLQVQLKRDRQRFGVRDKADRSEYADLDAVALRLMVGSYPAQILRPRIDRGAINDYGFAGSGVGG